MSNEAPLKTQRCENPGRGDRAADETWIVLGCHNSLRTSPQSTLQPVLKDTPDGTDSISPADLLPLRIGAAMIGNGNLVDLGI